MAAVYKFVLPSLLLCFIINFTLVSSKAILFDPVIYKEEWWRYQPNPDEMSGKFEGDIILTEDTRGAAVRDKNLTWPGGVIYYEIDPGFTAAEYLTIAAAMDQITSNTCLRFKARTNETDFIFLMKDVLQGCFSLVGRKGGSQILSIGPGCSSVGVILHELMHSIGFFHEHNRYDRDTYVRVHWLNILPEKDKFYVYCSLDKMDDLGLNYDYGSIMHHSMFAFAVNLSEPTLEPLTEGVIIGQRKELSETDIKKINKLYNCDKVENVNPCIDAEDGILLPHPTLLNKFYQCFQGTAHEFTCPSVLLFNPEVDVCDWPYNVQ